MSVSATISYVVQYRRLSALLLGVWLGASVLADIAVTQNFQAVDRFLASPGDTGTSQQLNAIGRGRERVILRRNAAEENNWIFTNWERAEFFLGGGVLLLFLFGERPQKLFVAGSISLIVILAAEHLLLTPRVVDLGRIVDELPKTDDRYKTFWMLHGFYSGIDILKMLLLFALAARVCIRGKLDDDYFARENELSNLSSPTPAEVLTKGHK
jgi:hypothetical protein